jgi:hypothetical protein
LSRSYTVLQEGFLLYGSDDGGGGGDDDDDSQYMLIVVCTRVLTSLKLQ